jgi:hypothetical protein
VDRSWHINLLNEMQEDIIKISKTASRRLCFHHDMIPEAMEPDERIQGGGSQG